MENFIVFRIYFISNNIRFMRVNFININGIFVYKCRYVLLMEESLVKILKILRVYDIKENGWF